MWYYGKIGVLDFLGKGSWANDHTENMTQWTVKIKSVKTDRSLFGLRLWKGTNAQS